MKSMVVLGAGDLAEIVVQQRRAGQRLEIGLELAGEHGLVGERPARRRILHEEIERIDRGHVGHEVHRCREFARLVRHDDARQEVAERVLLPVDEMRLGRDAQRIGEDRRAAVRGRPQAHDVRPEAHRPAVAVLRPVCEGDVVGHGSRAA